MATLRRTESHAPEPTVRELDDEEHPVVADGNDGMGNEICGLVACGQADDDGEVTADAMSSGIVDGMTDKVKDASNKVTETAE